MSIRWITLCLVAAAAVSFGAAAQAASILVVSDCDAPGVNPDGDHLDDSLVALIEGFGYTVDTSGMGKAMQEGADPFPFNNPTLVAAMNNADAIVVSRRTSSGGYDNELMRHAWNEITTPLVLMSGYLTRGGGSNKWGWTTGASGNTDVTVTDMVIESGQESHPFLSGTTASPDVTLFDWSAAPTPGSAPKTVYLPNAGTTVGGTTLVGTFDGRPMLFEIATGTDLDGGGTLKYGTTADRRVFFSTYGYDGNTDVQPNIPPNPYTDYLTDDHKTILRNVLNDVAPVPEPGTVALLISALLGLVVYRWRRK